MYHIARLLLASLALAACRKTPPPPPIVETHAGVDAAAVVLEVGSDDAASPMKAPSEGTTTQTMPDAGELHATASAVIAWAGGAIAVYASPEAEGSNVVGEVLDENGKRIGKPRLLRRTSGEVQSIALAMHDGVVWVAWASTLLTEDKHLAAYVTTNRTLTKVNAPVTLLHEVLDGGEPNHWIHAVALPNGNAMIATRSMGKTIPCVAHPDPNEKCRAPGYKVFEIVPNELPKMVKHGALDGNPLEMAAPVVALGAVAMRAYAWHGGAITDQSWFAVGDGGVPPIAFPFCNPPFDQAWTGDELVTLCEKDYPTSAKEKCPVGDEVMGCPRAVRELADGGTTNALVKAIDEACANDHPVIRVTRADKSSFTVDPTKAGAIVPRFAGWTGKVLLSPPNPGDGANAMPLLRRQCRGNALVAAP